MSMIDDLKQAIEEYPTTDVAISIVDIAPVPPATPVAVNVDEVWEFQVRVANNGHLNLTGIASLITVGSMTVNGGGTQDSATLYFKAPSVTKPAGTHLVNAHIADYSANFNHFFTNHTPHSYVPEGVYSAQVFP